MKYIFITGSNGFLGSKILDYLFENKLFDKTFALSRNPDYGVNTPHFFNISYEDFYYKINRIDDIDSGILLHLAFARSLDANSIMASIRLLEKVSAKAKDLGISTIINISSQSIYDQYRPKPAQENDLPVPQSLYGLAKYYSESYLEAFSEKYNLKIINLRLASLIGPGLNQRIIPRLINSALIDKQINIKSNEEQFSFLHVMDAAKMICEVAYKSDTVEELVYNVGINESFNLLEIVQMIVKFLKEVNIERPEVIIEESRGKQFNNSLCLKRFERDFNLFAQISHELAVKMEIMRFINEK